MPSTLLHIEFPGDALEVPSEEEWARAEKMARKPLSRENPSRTSIFSPYHANRAFLRSQLRRALNDQRRMAFRTPSPSRY